MKERNGKIEKKVECKVGISLVIYQSRATLELL
jgi:hypothetical protein